MTGRHRLLWIGLISLIEKQGDVFTTHARVIGHGVNCDGVMGAGIAKRVRADYPKTYLSYKARCLKDGLEPGDIHVTKEKELLILNMATQDRPGPSAQYHWVFECFFRAAKGLDPIREKYGNTIAIPEIGCGIGGLTWPNVSNIILTVEGIIPEVKFEVWHYGV